MTRIAVIADSHFDEHSRFEECVRIHDWIARDLIERGVDLVLHAGDLFERARSSARERMAVAQWLQFVAEQAPVVIVRGNHDGVGELPLFAELETSHPVIVVEDARLIYEAGVHVACLAWPRRAELVARYGEHGHDATEQVAGDALRACLRGLAVEADNACTGHERAPRILLAHAMVRGSMTSTGQPLVGCDLEIGLDDLALAGADVVALGHIHMGQRWDHATLPIVYPGSPRRTSYGELEEKAYLVIDIDDAGVRVERVVTPATPMLHITGSVGDVECPESGNTFRGLSIDEEAEGDVRGAEIRLRYAVASDERELGKTQAAAWKARLLGEGATDVKVEEVVIPVVRARAPEVAAAKTLTDKLVALWESRGDVPSPERADALFAKTHLLEEEHAA